MNNSLTLVTDSSALISLASITDQNHKVAQNVVNWIKENTITNVLPGEVLTESLNAIGRKFGHSPANLLYDQIINDRTFLIQETNQEIRSRAFEKFKDQSGSVSFTDCLVMAFSDYFKTKLIFGFDEDFKKNKYERLGVDYKVS